MNKGNNVQELRGFGGGGGRRDSNGSEGSSGGSGGGTSQPVDDSVDISEGQLLKETRCGTEHRTYQVVQMEYIILKIMDLYLVLLWRG